MCLCRTTPSSIGSVWLSALRVFDSFVFFFLLFVIAGTLKFALVDTLCHALSATSVYRGRFKQINDKNTKLCALEIDIDILYYFFFHFSLISLQDTK